MSEDAYMFGHTAPELDRLELQSTWLDPTTKRVLLNAGVESGMKVLDIGTGAGDVAFLAGRIVGQSGSVLGIDRNVEAIRRAKDRARTRELPHVEFRSSSLADFEPRGCFDAVIGRYVVEHQVDAVAFVRQAASLVRQGGIIAFVEPGHMNGYRYSTPPNPNWDRLRELLVQAFHRFPARLDQGLSLAHVFSDAGLPEPQMLGECLIAGPSSSLVELACASLNTLRGILEQSGDATHAEIEELIAVDRMRAATLASRSQLFWTPQIGAWTRVPS